jgi:hypothetical protein
MSQSVDEEMMGLLTALLARSLQYALRHR